MRRQRNVQIVRNTCTRPLEPLMLFTPERKKTDSAGNSKLPRKIGFFRGKSKSSAENPNLPQKMNDSGGKSKLPPKLLDFQRKIGNFSGIGESSAEVTKLRRVRRERMSRSLLKID